MMEDVKHCFIGSPYVYAKQDSVDLLYKWAATYNAVVRLTFLSWGANWPSSPPVSVKNMAETKLASTVRQLLGRYVAISHLVIYCSTIVRERASLALTCSFLSVRPSETLRGSARPSVRPSETPGDQDWR